MLFWAFFVLLILFAFPDFIRIKKAKAIGLFCKPGAKIWHYVETNWKRAVLCLGAHFRVFMREIALREKKQIDWISIIQ